MTQSPNLFTPEMLAKARERVRSPIKKLIRGECSETGSAVIAALHENGVITIMYEAIVYLQRDTRPKPSCKCDEAHSVVKLGHSRDCPWWKPDQLTAIEYDLVRGSIGCPPRHSDGSDHDFDWATYSDERTSYGVCRCGMSGLDWSLWTLP